jgi:hypothetical protein
MICKSEPLIYFGVETEMKGRPHDLGEGFGVGAEFRGGLLEKPFPTEDVDRLLSYGLRAM